MKILALNCGSSTLKFKVYDVDDSSRTEKEVANGIVKRIGGSGTIRIAVENSEDFQQTERIDDHADAARRVIVEFVWARK